jgi:predicted lipid-binding transport protein (Tim44 family)
MLLGKLIAGIVIGIILIITLKQWVFIIIGLIVLLYLIRLVADIFWWGKDNGKW